MVENGRPEYVVMHYDDYAELIGRNDMQERGRNASPEALASEDFTADTVFSGPTLPEDISKIRLEDLPL